MKLAGMEFTRRGFLAEIDNEWVPLDVALNNGETTLGTLPEEYRPVLYHWIVSGFKDRPELRLTVKNTGEVLVTNNGTAIPAGTRLSLESTLTYICNGD